MNDTTPILLKVEEAAAKLRVGRTTIYALIKSGDLAAVHVGRLCRIHPDDLNAYANNLRTTSTNVLTIAA